MPLRFEKSRPQIFCGRLFLRVSRDINGLESAELDQRLRCSQVSFEPRLR